MLPSSSRCCGKYTATFQWDGSADGAYIDFGSVVNGMKVTVNGKQIKDLNMNVPVLDISDALVVWKNSIELESNSNLANELLETGVLKEGDTGWVGYSISYRSYGSAQAVVVPYVEVEVFQQVELYFTDVGKNSPYASAVAGLVTDGWFTGYVNWAKTAGWMAGAVSTMHWAAIR